METDIAFTGYACNDCMIMQVLSFMDKRLHKCSADSFAAVFGLDIERCFTRVIICLAFRPFTQRYPSDNFSIEFSGPNWMSFIMRMKPLEPLTYALRFSVECCGCCENCLIIDVSDRIQIRQLCLSCHQRNFHLIIFLCQPGCLINEFCFRRSISNSVLRKLFC